MKVYTRKSLIVWPCLIHPNGSLPTSLFSQVFQGRWAPLSYTYNALKTKRWKGVHDAIWRDDQVKNIHYFLTPKPWDETPPVHADPTHAWWCEMNEKRKEDDKARGVTDGF